MAFTRVLIGSQGAIGDLSERIGEIHLQGQEDNLRKVLVVSKWGEKLCTISRDIIESSSDREFRLLQWYFKDYPTRDVFETNKAKDIQIRLREEGKRLVKEFFPSEVYRPEHREDHLLVEINVPPTASQDSSLPWLNKIHWEILEDKSIWSEAVSFEPSSIHVVRVHSSRRFNMLRSRTRRMSQIEKECAGRNVLAITARPLGSKDIPHRLITRSIASACTSAKKSTSAKIELQIVRPGTFKALSRHLENYPNGYFDILHLDLHGESNRQGARLHFVKFDHNAQAQPDKIDAAELAELITKHCIDTVVLNACESAAGADTASNMAHMLVEAGVKTAIGMSFEVLSLSAERFVKAFYEGLLAHNDSAVNAVSRARKALLQMPHRMTRYGVQIDLKDHVVPIMHCSKTTASEFAHSQARGASYNEPINSLQERLSPDLHGRETKIFELENLLAQRPPFKVLIRGSPGIGKTALIRNAAQWWTETGFYQSTIFLSLYEPDHRELTYSIFLRRIQEHVPSVHRDEKALIRELNRKSTLIVLDGLDAVVWQDNLNQAADIKGVNKFLQRLRKCSVVLVSRSNIIDLDWDISLSVDALDLEASVGLGLQYLSEQDPSGRITEIAKSELSDFKQLVGMMAGNPLAIKMMLYDLFHHFRSNKDLTIQSHIEALLDYRTVEIDLSPESPQSLGETRAIAELIAEFLVISGVKYVAGQLEVTTSATDPTGLDQSLEAGTLDSTNPVSDDSLYFRVCLSIMGFWNNMMVNYEDFATAFVCVDRAKRHLQGEALLVVLLALDTINESETNLLERIQQWASDQGRGHPMRPFLEDCCPMAAQACSWLSSLLGNQLRHHITIDDDVDDRVKPEELNVPYYTLNPVLTLVARSTLVRSFGPSELADSIDFAMLTQYIPKLFQAIQQMAIGLDSSLLSYGTKQADLGFWNLLSLTMALRRSRLPILPSNYGVVAGLPSLSARENIDRLPVVEKISRNCVSFVVEKLQAIKLALNSGWSSYTISLWYTSNFLEQVLQNVIPQGMECAWRTGISDDFYIGAWSFHKSNPFFMSNPFLDEKFRRLLCARQEQMSTVILWHHQDAPIVRIHDLEVARQAFLKAAFDYFGEERAVTAIHASDPYAYQRECAKIYGGNRNSIEYRFGEISQSHLGPYVRISTAEVLQRIDKLQDLLQEDLTPLWRSNVHRELFLNHNRIGDFMRAYEHARLQKEEETKLDPATLARLRGGQAQYETYWARKRAKSITWDTFLQECEASIQQEKEELQIALQSCSSDDRGILAKEYRIALFLTQMQRFADAVPYLKRVIEGRRRILDIDTAGVLEPIYGLAVALRWLNSLGEAILFLAPVVETAWQKADGQVLDNEFFVNAEIFLAELVILSVREATGQAKVFYVNILLPEAKGYLEHAMAFHEKERGPKSPIALRCKVALAALATEESDFERAETQLKEVILMRNSDTNDKCDDMIIQAEQTLAILLYTAERFEESETLLLDVLARQLERFGSSHVSTLESINYLGYFLYERRDKMDEARKLATEHFDVLIKSGRLQRRADGFAFREKSLGFLGRDPSEIIC